MATTSGSSSTPTASAITDISSIIKITPKISANLHDENDYPAWVIEAKRQLRRQKLLALVEGTEIKPDPVTTEWQDKSDKALDYLMDSVETEPGLKIRAWKQLQKHEQFSKRLMKAKPAAI